MNNRSSVPRNYRLPLFKELATQYRRRLFYQFFAWGCAGALAGALLLIAGVKLFQLPLGSSHLWSTLLPPLAAGLAFFLAPLPWPHLLQEADRNLGLQEKLITLAQYYDCDPDNPFLPLLEATLHAEVGDLSTKRLFPLPKTPFLVMAGSAVCLFTLVLLPGRPALVSPPDAAPPAAAVAEAPDRPESFAEISSEPVRPATEALSPSAPPANLPETGPLGRPDLRSRLESPPESSTTQAEPRGKPEGGGAASPPETAVGVSARPGRPEWEEEAAEETSEAAADGGSLESTNGTPAPSTGAETGEISGGQNGETARPEKTPDEDNFSSSGAGRRAGTTHPVEMTASFEPVLEYNPLSTSSQISKESYLSSYLEELYPPAPGLPPGEAQFRERLRQHAQVLAANGSEELPGAYRELIRAYFSLLATEE